MLPLQAMASVFDEDIPQKKKDKTRASKADERVKLSPQELAEGKSKLFKMVTRAFDTLEQAMNEGDFNNAVKAAQIILDRTGFGPKSSIDVSATIQDLSGLSHEELATRAQKLLEQLRAKGIEPITTIPMSTAVN